MDDEKRFGAAIPTFGRVFFSPDDPATGDPEMPTTGSTTETPATNSEIPAGGATEPKNWEKELTDYKAGEPARLEEIRQDTLRKWAMQSPQHYKLATGQDAPPGTFQDAEPKAAPKPGETPEEERPLTRKEMEAEFARRDRASFDQRRAEEIKGKVYDEFDKFEDVFDPAKNQLAEWAQQAAGNEVRAMAKRGLNPDVAKIVADTAKKYRDFAAARDAKYVNGKVDASGKLPPPSGKGAPPGKPPEGKLKLGKGPGTYQEKMLQALRAGRTGGSKDDI